jgi:tetratricopeptide (TPR) repeat protein
VKPRTLPIVILALFCSAVEVQPRTYSVRAGRDLTAVRLVNKGVILLEEKKFAEARRSFDLALRFDPTMWPAYYNRGRLFLQKEQYDAAARDFDMAIRLKPSFYVSTIKRAVAFFYQGKCERSLADINRVLSLHPIEDTRAMALNLRAWLRVVCPDSSFRNGREALLDAKAACTITNWGNASYLDTLAAVYAELGDFDAALRYEQKAIASDHDKELTEPNHRIALFSEHRTVRDAGH